MPSRRLYLSMQLAAHRVRAVADLQAKTRLGVTAAQLGMLFVVAGQPGGTQRDVAQALQLRESGVTAAMAKLDALGLIRRERPNGRSIALFLTEAGEAVVAGAQPLVRELEATLSEGFSEAEITTVSRFLARATARFEETS